jgi:transcriptional regulator with XRE-family HTH domain
VGKKLKQDSENIGSLIKSYREKASMTQKTLSEFLGYENPQFVSLIENGHSKVPLNVLGKVIDALKIPEKKILDVLLAAYQKEIVAEIELSSKKNRQIG